MSWINNQVWGIIGVAIGVIGILIACIFYRRSRRSKKIYFDSRAFQLISYHTASVPGLNFSYNNKELFDLCAVKVMLWNAGNEVIHSGDFASTDYLKLAIPAGKIVYAHISYQTRPTNLFTLSKIAGDAEMDIQFDYIGSGEGAIVLLLTTQSEGNPPEMQGTIKGFGTPLAQTTNKITEGVLRAVLIVFAGFLIVTYSVIAILSVKLALNFSAWKATLMMIISTITTSFALGYFTYRFLDLLLGKLPPRFGVDTKLAKLFESDFRATDIIH